MFAEDLQALQLVIFPFWSMSESEDLILTLGAVVYGKCMN